MVEYQEDEQLDAIFHALGDPTRRLMLRRLAQGESTVGQLAEPCHMSLAAASKHIKALEAAGLILREVQGRVHVCRLDAAPLSAASEWLRHYEKFWTARLDRLDELLRADRDRDRATPHARREPKASASTTPESKSKSKPKPKPEQKVRGAASPRSPSRSTPPRKRGSR